MNYECQTYFEKYNIPYPIVDKRVLYLFDIDGVVCEALPYQIESNMTREEYNKMISGRNCLPIFLNTLNVIMKRSYNFSIRFLTGRYQWSKDITESMFIQSQIGIFTPNILYYPDHLRWYSEDYINHKYNVIKNLLGYYDLVYFFDDTKLLMDKLTELFKNEPKLKLIHIK